MSATRIQLDDETCALVDVADVALLGGFNWRPLRLKNLTYAHAWHGRMHLYMHRFLLGVVDPKMWVDHRNGDGLDNRRFNLRLATRSQNLVNVGKRAPKGDGPHSPYKGVWWESGRRRWAAGISINGCRRSLGRFDDEVAAARAYDQAAREAWGEFARLNFEDAT